MRASEPITITSQELRKQVEANAGQKIPDELWNKSEKYARRKLDSHRERSPEVNYYGNAYLVLLTEDTINEIAFSAFTMAATELITEAREAQTKGAEQ